MLSRNDVFTAIIWISALFAFIHGLVTHDFMGILIFIVVGASEIVRDVLNICARRIIMHHSEERRTDEIRYAYGGPVLRRTIDIVPIVVDWPIYSHAELLLPVHNCNCGYCDHKRKSRYDDED